MIYERLHDTPPLQQMTTETILWMVPRTGYIWQTPAAVTTNGGYLVAIWGPRQATAYSSGDRKSYHVVKFNLVRATVKLLPTYKVKRWTDLQAHCFRLDRFYYVTVLLLRLKTGDCPLTCMVSFKSFTMGISLVFFTVNCKHLLVIHLNVRRYKMYICFFTLYSERGAFNLLITCLVVCNIGCYRNRMRFY